MRLGDYLRGYRRTMTSSLPPREVERRINAAAMSILWPVGAGVAGWARFGWLNLKVREGSWRFTRRLS